MVIEIVSNGILYSNYMENQYVQQYGLKKHKA